MPFTLSAAQTINGVPNSYEVTGTGNLDDLVNACSSVGLTRSNNVITFSPAANRILAISGTLTEDRAGIRTIQIRNGGHICWAYSAGSIITFGAKNANGVYTSAVDCIYESTALTLGDGAYILAKGKCFSGAGTFTHICGSVAYNHASRSDLDVSNDSTLCSFDNVRYFMATEGLSYTHLWKPSGKTVTTDKTVFNFIQRPMEGTSSVSEVTPVYIDTGFRWLNAAPNSVLRVLRPTYSAVDTASSASDSCRIDVIDPLTPYMGWYNNTPGYGVHQGSKRIIRTLKATWTDLLGQAIPNAKLICVHPSGAVTTDNFSGKTAEKELLQSTRASGVQHDSTGQTGTGYTNEGSYSFHNVGFGYAAKTENVSLLTAHGGNSGVVISQASGKSPLVTTAYASVVTAPFSFSTTGNGTLTVSGSATTSQVAEYLFKLAYDNADDAFWRNLGHTPAWMHDSTIDFGSISIIATGAGTQLSGSGVQTSGTVSTSGGALISAAVQDANGVRVTVRKSGGGNFNIATRYGSGSTYTDLGYQADVSTITYTVPKGQPVEVVMWALGYVTYSRLISTINGGVVFDAEMTLNEGINTSLDVSPYLPNIALSLDTSGASPVFVVTFNAPMTIAGIELGKAVIHRLVGQEIALKAGFPPGSTATIVINSDEITNQLPAARLALGAGLSVTDRVYLDFFINTAQALAINPAYVINPPRADGNQVVILRAKPALDASVMALAVRQEIERTGGMLDGKASQASVTVLATANQAEHDATQAAIAALPAPLTATQTRAQVDAALTVYDAVVPADLAILATAAQVTALGAPLQASSYTAPPSATSTAQAVRAELATELGRMDAAVSSRLASASYIAPTAPPTAAQNATAVRTELATELGRIDATIGSRLAAADYVAPANSDIATIKTKVDTLENADLSGVATAAQVTALGSPLQAADYVTPDNATITEIKTLVEQQTDTVLQANQVIINAGVKQASLLIPHSQNVTAP